MEKKLAQPWHDELHRYEEQYKRWTERGESIVKRYRDERKDSEGTDARFNILWSNIRTLKPAIYGKVPKPEISRRFDDQNPVARVASTILERVLSYEINQYPDFHASLSNVVDDRLLCGRGVAWIRYEPIIETVDAEPFITDDKEVGGETYEQNGLAGQEPLERIETETSPVDYVYWPDFAHLPARTWEEVTWVARRVYLSKDEGLERFGEIFEQVPLTSSPDKKDGDKATTDQLKKAEVWEIWDKSAKCVYWVSQNYEYILDHREDPLDLEQFFPCPKPYFATISTGSLVPIPDFIQYQDQANEIDDITGRIQHLTKALKVMGIYAADEPSIERLLKEGNDAVLVPVKNWQQFIEKGGIAGAVQFMPLRDVIQALQQLYQAREACKQVIYEITGLSDIIRGASNAAETATAQQIKSQFASLRLNDMKDDMSRFACSVLRMKCEVICSKYQPETILQMSGIQYTADAQLAPQAIQLLKNETLRNFNIDIETDTLVLIDKQTEKQNKVEFLTAVGGFLKQAVEASQTAPQLVPLMGEMLLFGIRGFSAGRGLEANFEQMIEQAKEAAQQPRPDPHAAEQQAAQMEMQAKQAELQQSAQLEQLKLQAAAQETQVKTQLEQSKMQFDQAIEAQRLQLEQWKAQLQADTQVLIAEMNAKNAIKQTSMTINGNKEAEGLTVLDEEGAEQPTSALSGLIEAVNSNFMQMVEMSTMQNQMMMDKHNQMMAQLSQPKQVLRDSTGKIIGVK
jgi:hypothetical protein